MKSREIILGTSIWILPERYDLVEAIGAGGFGQVW